jgi:hypothetical protein
MLNTQPSKCIMSLYDYDYMYFIVANSGTMIKTIRSKSLMCITL